jgi:catechol 2,3-dioxygenase-like lactoylglutathione lyase family enzyme
VTSRRDSHGLATGTPVPVTLNSLDHVALWTDERERLARLLVDCCGMHEIERTDRFTLVGGDARLGKLTLFDAEGPRDPGVLERVVLRVPDPAEAAERLAAAGATLDDDGGMATAETGAGLALGLVPAEDGVADLDCVVLRVPNPESTVAGLAELGLEREGDHLRVAGKDVVVHGGGVPEGERPLLNHLAFLVDRADDAEQEARARGIEVADVVDAPNTRAVFVWGPDRIKLEYVEHKPGFSLV